MAPPNLLNLTALYTAFGGTPTGEVHVLININI